MPKPRRGDPELLLVSFCDIVTVTTSALFMAMIIVIDQSSKTPLYRPTPISVETTNAPVYFECRDNQLFYIDRTNLLSILRKSAEESKPAAGTNTTQVLGALLNRDIGDDVYRFDNRFLLLGEIALLPRTNATGLTVTDLDSKANNKFQKMLQRLNRENQYLVFLVRDDSFPAFRKVRDMAVNMGFISGWEFLEREEPITFVGALARIKAQ